MPTNKKSKQATTATKTSLKSKVKTNVAKGLKYVADKLEKKAADMSIAAARRKAKAAQAKTEPGAVSKLGRRVSEGVKKALGRKPKPQPAQGKDLHLIPKRGEKLQIGKKDSLIVEKIQRHNTDVKLQQGQQRMKTALNKRKAVSTYPRSR